MARDVTNSRNSEWDYIYLWDTRFGKLFHLNAIGRFLLVASSIFWCIERPLYPAISTAVDGEWRVSGIPRKQPLRMLESGLN